MANFGYTSPKGRVEKVLWGIAFASILGFVVYAAIHNVV